MCLRISGFFLNLFRLIKSFCFLFFPKKGKIQHRNQQLHIRLNNYLKTTETQQKHLFISGHRNLLESVSEPNMICSSDYKCNHVFIGFIVKMLAASPT